MTGYKCYLLSSKHLCVYGVITENQKGIGLKRLYINKNGKLKDNVYDSASYIFKPYLEKWEVESTLSEQEAINFINKCKELKALGLK